MLIYLRDLCEGDNKSCSLLKPIKQEGTTLYYEYKCNNDINLIECDN